MKSTIKYLFIFLFTLLVSCGSDNKREKTTDLPVKKERVKRNPEKKKENIIVKKEKAEIKIDLTDKGVGQVKNISLGTLNKTLATKGATLFKVKCTACHKINKKFIGPELKGVIQRRSPEWIMNMILNPEKMLVENKIAKALLEEYKSPMVNQNLTKEEARAILEYFRTL